MKIRFHLKYTLLVSFLFIALVLSIVNCKPRRSQNNLSSDSSKEVCEEIGEAVCEINQGLNEAMFGSEIFASVEDVRRYEAWIYEKLQSDKYRYEEKLGYLGLFAANLGKVEFRRFYENLDGIEANFRNAIKVVINYDRNRFWTDKAKEDYKVCVDPIQCLAWDTHVFSVSGRAPELYSVFQEMAQNISEDLYTLNPSKDTVQSPESQALAFKLVFDVRALSFKFFKITDFEALNPDNSAHKNPEADVNELAQLKQEIAQKLKMYKKLLVHPTDKNKIKDEIKFAYANEMKIVRSDQESFMMQMYYENPESYYEEQYKALQFEEDVAKLDEELAALVIEFEQALWLSLSEMQALYWYCDRINLYRYEDIRKWMMGIRDLVQERGDTSEDLAIAPYSSFFFLIANFFERETSLPHFDLFISSVDALIRDLPTSAVYEDSSFQTDRRLSLKALKDKMIPFKQGRLSRLETSLRTFGIPADMARRLVQNEKFFTIYKGFQSLEYQLYYMILHSKRVSEIQSDITAKKLGSQEELQRKNFELEEEMNQLATKTLNFLCLDFYKDNRSNTMIDAGVLSMDTSINPNWCSDYFRKYLAGSANRSCGLQKNNKISLRDFCPLQSPNLSFFDIETKGFGCIVENKIQQSCGNLELQAFQQIVTTIALPGVGTTASALTRLTTAAGRRLIGGSFGIAVQASKAPGFAAWLVHSSIEGAYFGIVNSLVLLPLAGFEVAFYDPKKTVYENGVGMLKSYLWSFAFFGFSRHMDSIAKTVHKKVASSLIGARLAFGGRSNPKVMEGWFNYYRNFRNADRVRQGIQQYQVAKNLGDFRLFKDMWIKSALKDSLPPRYLKWSFYSNSSRIGTELVGFRAIEIVEHKTTPYYDYLFGVAQEHAEMHMETGWGEWAKGEGTALLSTLSTVLAFRIKSWHHIYDRKFIKPKLLQLEAKLDQGLTPHFRFGLGDRKLSSVTKSKEAYEEFLKYARSYTHERLGVLQGDLAMQSEAGKKIEGLEGQLKELKNKIRNIPPQSSNYPTLQVEMQRVEKEIIKLRFEATSGKETSKYITSQIDSLKRDYASISDYDKMKALADKKNKF